MSRLKQRSRYRLVHRWLIERHAPLLLFMLAIVMLQAGCSVTGGTSIYVRTWRCETLLRQPTTRQRIRVTSDPPFNPLSAGGARRFFTAFDWNEDTLRDVNDVKLDWHRYLYNTILPSPRFAGLTWCIEPRTTNCTESFGTTLAGPPAALPEAEFLLPCSPEPSDAQLEISAPGLASAAAGFYSLSFPDTPIGTSRSITLTLRNVRTAPLRVNSIDFLATTDGPDFERLDVDCLPTEDERGRNLGHELRGGESCSLQVTFRPQNRAGVAECDRDDTRNMSCQRAAVLRITSETLSGEVLPSFTVSFNGRAIGGRLVVEPNPICFQIAPMPPMCTERTITIHNVGASATTGNIRINLSAILFPRRNFAVRPMRYTGLTLVPDDSITAVVQYCSREPDMVDNTYTIFSSAPRDPTVSVAIINPRNGTCP